MNPNAQANRQKISHLRAPTPKPTAQPPTMTDMRANRLDQNDPKIAKLQQLADQYHADEQKMLTTKAALDRQLAAMKKAGYSYPVLARTAGIAIASVQYAVAKEAQTGKA